MICPNCGHELSDHATLCPYCGSSWNHIKNDEQKAIRYCIHCGREIPVSAKFCPQCGTSCGSAIYKNSMEETIDDCNMEENVGNYKRFSNLSNAIMVKLKNWKMVCANKRWIIFAILMLVTVLGAINAYRYFQRQMEAGVYYLEIGDVLSLKSVNVDLDFVGAGILDIDYQTQEAQLYWGFYIEKTGDKAPGGIWINGCDTSTGQYRINSKKKILSWTDTTSYPISVSDVVQTSFLNMVPINSNESTGYIISASVPVNSLDIALKISVNDQIEVVLNFSENIVDKYQEFVDTIDWRDEDTVDNEFVKDNLYKITGEVLYSGEYYSVDTYQIALITAYSPFVNAFAYFDSTAWEEVPNLATGDTITFYGTYDFWMMGWNFKNCSMEFPYQITP